MVYCTIWICGLMTCIKFEILLAVSSILIFGPSTDVCSLSLSLSRLPRAPPPHSSDINVRWLNNI